MRYTATLGRFLSVVSTLFVDLCPIDISHTKEILGLNTYFRPVLQKPQGFGASITSGTLNASEFSGTNGRATMCKLDNELFESGMLRTSVSSNGGEVDHPLFLTGAASLGNSLANVRLGYHGPSRC
jgi:hypothetical protein